MINELLSFLARFADDVIAVLNDGYEAQMTEGGGAPYAAFLL